MDNNTLSIISGGGSETKKGFLSHVLSTTDEGKAEILNVLQYSSLGVIPIVILNKLVQRFIPEADPDKTSLEILVEILIQLIMMFCGIVLIHRMITYVPTYSGFNYESLALTNVVLAFLVVVLSIQTKLGIKVNIIVDRLTDMWNGTDSNAERAKQRARSHINNHSILAHNPSQADILDNAPSGGMFPPPPVMTASKPQAAAPAVINNSPINSMGPMAANSLLGGAFGSLF